MQQLIDLKFDIIEITKHLKPDVKWFETIRNQLKKTKRELIGLLNETKSNSKNKI